jgi:uncharacterized protein YggT (Ycf19 family)
MHDLVYRLVVFSWFLAYMASIYLALHIVVARLSNTPDSRLLWFFGVLTGPLTYPIRAVVPAGTPETRVRYIALAVCVLCWLVTRMLLSGIGEGGS